MPPKSLLSIIIIIIIINNNNNPAVEQSKIIRSSESPCNQSGRKGKGLWRKGFAEVHVLIIAPTII